MFNGVRAVIVCRILGFSGKSAEIIKEKILKYSGQASIVGTDPIATSPTHIIVPSNIPPDLLNEKLGELSNNPQIHIVAPEWAYNSILKQSVEPESEYAVKLGLSIKRPRAPSPEPPAPLQQPQPQLQCPKTKRNDLNNHIVGEFERLQKYTEALGDQGRAIAYSKVIRILRNTPEKITDASQLKNFKGIGSKTLEKIREILSTGYSIKAETLSKNKRLRSLESLQTVHGIGSTLSSALLAKGIDSVSSLQAYAAAHSTEFTAVQLDSLQLHSDFQLKIPRSEIEATASLIQPILSRIDSDASFTICGSYRRGKEFCGDMDFLITAVVRDGILPQLIPELKELSLITHSFANSKHTFQGVSKLPQSPHRRIDIFVVARKSYAFALLSYTGSKNYNKMVRYEAKKRGLHLSHTTLTHRQTGKQVLETSSEIAILEFLHLPVVPPESRNL